MNFWPESNNFIISKLEGIEIARQGHGSFRRWTTPATRTRIFETADSIDNHGANNSGAPAEVPDRDLSSALV